MRFGLTIPNLGEYADAGLLGDLAAEAEAAGWDGVFLWDHLAYRREPVFAAVDPWVALTVVAERTERVLLGPMVTPLARRRPQDVARQATMAERGSAAASRSSSRATAPAPSARPTWPRPAPPGGSST